MSSSEERSMVPVLAGGGSRLSAHIGVLTALQELDIEFSDLVGVSGGSIVGALYACGWPLSEIREIAEATDFGQFLDQSLFSLLRTGGLSTGDRFEQWIDDKLKGARFCDLKQRFHVVATDVRSGLPVIFDVDRTPELKVSQAVRFSMSIPILFSFKEFKDHLMVDGSILSEDALQRDWAGDGSTVVVFRLRSLQSAEKVKRLPLFPLKSYLALLIRTFMTTMSREYINESFWHSTVVIHTGSVSPIEFKLSPEQKNELYQAGYDTARRIVPMKLARVSARMGTIEKIASLDTE
ncbi:patatin-like phospholipase family protein [Motiliproteus sp. MSK22-1]|uniref:patatin-like phospholipase family protein n=1 Tax=Motiliproteus sp. MSK22-1 TaxID=1897630 RepID=UPI0009778720|nr:patatin-like phospholipase family protein [Motiliproteus sp. MSK22-1]OMH25657.1 phospholipase [Motiliproteus sp. MSK22-1]